MPRPWKAGRTIHPTSSTGSPCHSDVQIPIWPAGAPPASGTIAKYHGSSATVLRRLRCASAAESGETAPPSSPITSGSHSSACVSARSSSE